MPRKTKKTVGERLLDGDGHSHLVAMAKSAMEESLGDRGLAIEMLAETYGLEYLNGYDMGKDIILKWEPIGNRRRRRIK